jgi:hypothetical protein
MSVLEKIRQESESLTPEEKITLADFLLSDKAMTETADKYWRDEMQRRHQRDLNGESRYVTSDEFTKKYSETNLSKR